MFILWPAEVMSLYSVTGRCRCAVFTSTRKMDPEDFFKTLITVDKTTHSSLVERKLPRTVFGEVYGSNFSRNTGYASEVVRGFPQPLQAHVGHDPPLSESFQLDIYQQSYYSVLFALYTDSVSK
jgi:hypothetical protein